MYFLISQRFIKPSCHTLRLYGVRCISAIHTSLHQIEHIWHSSHPCIPPSTISSGVPTSVFQCLWNIVLECVERIITVLPQVLLDCALKELNKVEFIVKLG